MSLGKDVSCAVDGKGLVWAWGPNKRGELGVGDSEPRVHPFPLLDLKEKAVSVACCGDDFTVSLGTNVAMGECMTDLKIKTTSQRSFKREQRKLQKRQAKNNVST